MKFATYLMILLAIVSILASNAEVLNPQKVLFWFYLNVFQSSVCRVPFLANYTMQFKSRVLPGLTVLENIIFLNNFEINGVLRSNKCVCCVETIFMFTSFFLFQSNIYWKTFITFCKPPGKNAHWNQK